MIVRQHDLSLYLLIKSDHFWSLWSFLKTLIMYWHLTAIHLPAPRRHSRLQQGQRLPSLHQRQPCLSVLCPQEVWRLFQPPLWSYGNHPWYSERCRLHLWFRPAFRPGENLQRCRTNRVTYGNFAEKCQAALAPGQATLPGNAQQPVLVQQVSLFLDRKILRKFWSKNRISPARPLTSSPSSPNNPSWPNRWIFTEISPNPLRNSDLRTTGLDPARPGRKCHDPAEHVLYWSCEIR